VRLSKPGYRQVARQVSLQPQQTQELSVSLPPEYGVVFVTARPADASMKIDGKPSGEATRRLRLTTRPHTLSFSKPGYVSQQITVTPRVGVSKTVDVTLKTQAQLDSARKAASTPALLTTAGGQQLRLIRPGGSFTMGALKVPDWYSLSARFTSPKKKSAMHSSGVFAPRTIPAWRKECRWAEIPCRLSMSAGRMRPVTATG
jgi:hypothetical protein